MSKVLSPLTGAQATFRRCRTCNRDLPSKEFSDTNGFVCSSCVASSNKTASSPSKSRNMSASAPPAINVSEEKTESVASTSSETSEAPSTSSDSSYNAECAQIGKEIVVFLNEAWKKTCTVRLNYKPHETSAVPPGAFIWDDVQINRFFDLIVSLCLRMKSLLRSQAYPYLKLASPIFVLGDLHGSFDDLHFFVQELCHGLLPKVPGKFPAHLSSQIRPSPKNKQPKDPKKPLVISPNVRVLLGNGQHQNDAFGSFKDCCTPSNKFFFGAAASAQPAKPGNLSHMILQRNALNAATAVGGHDSSIATDPDRMSLLFLGDYVDRGYADVEVAMYVLALKAFHSNRVYLLRGNHEISQVNQQYGFYESCVSLFGEERGTRAWTIINEVFVCIPAAASVDGRVFCAHAGIPRIGRTETGQEASDDRLQILEQSDWSLLQNAVPPSNDAERKMMRRQCELFHDLTWSDPADIETVLAEDGFGDNSNKRGPGMVCYGAQAVEGFFKSNNFELLLRAHEPKPSGFQVQKSGRVLTVFSSSLYCGSDNTAAGVYIDGNTVQIVARGKTTAVEGGERPHCECGGSGI